MSQTGTSVPMKLPEWITGRSFVASATPIITERGARRSLPLHTAREKI
jgi:hypothetical protein